MMERPDGEEDHDEHRGCCDRNQGFDVHTRDEPSLIALTKIGCRQRRVTELSDPQHVTEGKTDSFVVESGSSSAITPQWVLVVVP